MIRWGSFLFPLINMENVAHKYMALQVIQWLLLMNADSIMLRNILYSFYLLFIYLLINTCHIYYLKNIIVNINNLYIYYCKLTQTSY